MNTPIADFIDEYAKKQTIRAHMPGHKGKGDIEALDITEIPGADVLYSSRGIIRESEENAARLFGSRRTVYSTEGSSLSIRGMLFLIRLYAESLGKPCRLLACRNAHRVFITACALLDIGVDWIYPTDCSFLTCRLTPERLDSLLSERADNPPAAVFITSPDYLGSIADIAGLSEVCRCHGVLLAVDNAHGAYLAFLEPSRHPIALGADICCDSAHKTLHALTGCGYLHIGDGAAAGLFADNAERAMALFATTSPSYLLLRSLDLLNSSLTGSYRRELSDCVSDVSKAKARLSEGGFVLYGGDPLRITIDAPASGRDGNALAASLDGIVCEMADRDNLVMMFTPSNNAGDIDRAADALLKIGAREPLRRQMPALHLPVLAAGMSPREALLAPSETIPAAEGEGRVLSDPAVSCPPAVPIAVCGEIVTAGAVKLFEYFGIDKINVVRRGYEIIEKT
ncbi:MAG: amino acid decarboxylase [Clostridiales bacterium]|nr:amino acid decarboxylase [Clostridiales bacterium]